MSDPSDHILLDRISLGDPEALNALFRRYYPRLCDFAMHYLRDLDRAEDVVSSVFISIWESREKLEISGSLKSYLFVSTRNRSYNHIDKEMRRNRRHVWIDEVQAGTNETRPDRPLEIKEFEQAMDLLLESMPPRRKEIFKLSRIDGFAYKEIGEILSISVRTVQNHMVEALRDLEKIQERFESRH